MLQCGPKVERLHRSLSEHARNFSSTWILCCAIAALSVAFTYIILSISSVYDEVYHDYATSKANADAQEYFYNECFRLTAVEELVSCFGDAIESAGEPQRAEEDLYAQKQMAKWAERLLWVTFLIGTASIGVAVVGIVLIGNTLHVQRKATDNAAQAVHEAAKANILTREAFIIEQRPWIAVTADIESGITYNDEHCCIAISHFVRNTGMTPAVKVYFQFRVTTTPLGRGVDIRTQTLREIEMAKLFSASFGDVIFPDEKPTLIQSVDIRVPMMGHTLIDPYFIGGVVYQSPIDATEYETGFAYELAGFGRDGSRVRIDINDGEIPKERLALIRVRGANFAT